MLQDKFYTLLQETPNADGGICYHIEINAQDPIFGGHFPGQPISPGVCNIEMIKECAEKQTGHSLFLNKIKQCKFNHLIIPGESKDLKINLQTEPQADYTYLVKASIYSGDLKCVELKAEGKEV